MPVTTYTTINGEIVSENRNGVQRDYVPDPLGSTIALLDQNQQKTDTFSYWPYGELRSRTGTTPTPFQFGGTLGYYRDKIERVYVRARSYRPNLARWQSVDPLWPSRAAPPYQFGRANPLRYTDPSGRLTIQGCGRSWNSVVGPLNEMCATLVGISPVALHWIRECVERNARARRIRCGFPDLLTQWDRITRFCLIGEVRCRCSTCDQYCVTRCGYAERGNPPVIVLCIDHILRGECDITFRVGPQNQWLVTLVHEMFHIAGPRQHGYVGVPPNVAEPPLEWACQELAACCFLEVSRGTLRPDNCRLR